MATLEYEFTESGLSELRSEMQDLAEETEDVGDRADDTASDLEDMADTDAGETVSQQMEDARQSVTDVGEEAQDTARRLQEEFEAASDRAAADIQGIQDQLDGLQGFDLSVGGDIVGDLGGGGGGLGTALGAALGAGALAEIEAVRRSIKSLDDLEVNIAGLEGVSAELERVEKRAEDAEQSMQDAQDELEEALGGETMSGDAPAEADGGMQDLSGGGGGVGTGGAGFLLGRFGGGGGMARFAARAASVATGIGAVGAAAATATKQMADFAAAQAAAGQQLKVAQAQSGVAAEKIEEVFLVAQRLDSTVDLDAIRDAFKELALRTEEAREGSGEAKEAFDRLGISMQELEGMSTAEVFQRVRREASKMTAQQRALTLEQIAGGEAGERLARVFGLQADEYQRLKESVAGDQLTSEQIDRLDDLRQQYTDAQQDLEDLKQELALEFGPAAIGVFKGFTQAVQDAVKALGKLRSENPVRTQNQAPYSGGGEITGDGSEIQEPTFGPQQRVQFGDTGSGGSDGEVEEPVQSMNEALSRMETQIAVAREKMSQGLIDKEEMLRQIRRARQAAVDELLKLEENHPDLIPDSEVDSTISALKRIKERIEELTSEDTSFDIDPEQVQAAGQEPLQGQPSIEAPSSLSSIQGQTRAADSIADINDLIRTTREQFNLLNNQEARSFISRLEEIRGRVQQQVTSAVPDRLGGPGAGLSSFRGAAEAADSVGDINSLIEATRAQFDTLNNDEAQAFIARLEKAKAEMEETQTEAELIGDALARSVARSADRVFNALGEAVSGAIFGGGSGPGEAQARLNLFNAKEQVRSLRKSLRKGNLSYRNFQLKMAAQQNKIQRRQEQLNDSMQSGFAQAAESMVGAFQKVAKQLIAEITAVIAKMAVLKAVTMIPGLGQAGGFAGAVISNLGGGAFLEPDSGASGGMVKQSGLAVIHENEQILNADTVSMLGDLLQPSTPSAQPAMTGGGGMNVTVNVTGQTTTDGRDLKTAYDQTSRIQRRKGRRE
ncbi:uncharacterized Zn finger protein (UPF0148 family) [Salinibacter ruber]|uniref:hypothetical protein n=1 Tax=Salinibacter ruber TaxID=146919 RepID=UPI002169C74E|nr:hypothetical protein [Salinibacter ruber]MCS3707179.1 uncharacterized Zn finger protein (UPF0148 family) [Salinibacter ruber]